jgi:hypothetical protein
MFPSAISAVRLGRAQHLIGAGGCKKAIQQRLPLGGVGALRAAEMAYIVVLVHELSGRELHRGASWRSETRRHSANREISSTGAIRKPSRTLGLIVLLNEPM